MENYNLNVKHVLICHNYFLSFCGYLTKKLQIDTFVSSELLWLAGNGGGMASKGVRSDVPINRDERLMRVMNFAYY